MKALKPRWRLSASDSAVDYVRTLRHVQVDNDPEGRVDKNPQVHTYMASVSHHYAQVPNDPYTLCGSRQELSISHSQVAVISKGPR